jgi:hypothetical protein
MVRDALNDVPETVYHVTLTKHAPKIKKQGLRRFKTSNWVKGTSSGERYGEGEIYTFEHPDDARRWASKMDWDLHMKTGSGKVGVISVRSQGTEWQEDDADSLSRVGARGRWLKSERSIPTKNIGDFEPFTQEQARALVQQL